MELPNKKFQVIYADPPWEYGRGVYQVYRPCNKGEKRFINDFYETMSIDELKALPIQNITDKDCALFMWFTYSHLKQAIELVESWGFEYKTIAFIWIKKSNGGKTLANIGAWTMGNSEMCLIATKGSMLKYKKSNNVQQIVKAVRTKHSKKPLCIYSKIDELFPDCNKIELFSRSGVDGWYRYGNELSDTVQKRLS